MELKITVKLDESQMKLLTKALEKATVRAKFVGRKR